MKDDQKIRKGLPPRRDPTCYRVEQDIVIPAGTILRQEHCDEFMTKVGPTGQFSLYIEPGDPAPDGFRKVVA